MVANVDGTNAADVSIDIHTAANGTAGTSFALAANITSAATNVIFGLNTSASGGGTTFEMANNISVPSSATLSIIDKNNTFYLLENQSLVGSASASSSIDLVISYEDIS